MLCRRLCLLSRAVLLTLPVVMSGLFASVSAQEYSPGNAQEYVPSPRQFRTTEPIQSSNWLEALVPAESNHPGLLGKRYIEGRYMHIEIDDVPDGFTDDFDGFVLGMNSPLFQSKEYVPFQVDGFANWMRVSFSTDIPFPIFDPPFFQMGTMSAVQNAVDVGATLHTNAFTGFRPFLQMGVRITHDRLNVSVPTVFDSSETTSDETFLFIPGFEVDLTQHAALRTAFDLQLEDQEDLDSSPASIDLIVWPHDSIFLRAGFMTALDGSAAGITAGGGFSF